MRKNLQKIAVAVVITSVIGAIAAYNISAEQTRQRGLQFGIELEQIQNDVKDLQDRFYSEKTKWDEGAISKEQLMEYYDIHVTEMEDVIREYDRLAPPELFEGAVELLKISTQIQLQSDEEFIRWISTGDESAKIRSDALIQETLEYELQGLVEFYSAKTGVKNYDEPEFQAPQSGLAQKVLQVAENMREQCDKEFRNAAGGFDSDGIEREWFNCTNEAERWKIEHLP